MKTLVSVILALGIGFAAAYVVVTQQKNAELKKLQSAQPEAAAAPAPAPVEKVIMASAPSGTAEESPSDILNDLLDVKLGTSSERNSGLRFVVYKLETLAHHGNPSVPAIRSFLGKNVDVDYSQQNNQNQNAGQPQAQTDPNANNAGNNDQTNISNAGNGGNNRRGNRGNNGGGPGGGGNNFRGARRARNLQTLETDWVVPPSLRLGLVSTLKEIGGADAEQALVEMLSSTARGVEVAYLTVILEELAPGKYRDQAIAAAKDLLANPPAVDSPDSLDQLSKSYLYGVLEFYKDASFAINAQQMLVGADGRLDQDALDYLSTVLKDQSVSALYSAYQNPALTNQFDKMSLGREVLNYVGQSSQANQLFTDTLNNPDINSRAKLMSIVQLAGGGPFGGNAPTDPQIISQRITFLQSIASQYTSDSDLSMTLNATINSLQSGNPVNMQDIFNPGGGQGGQGGGGGGGRRNRGGGGGGGFGGGGNGGN
ncbi:MAG TPA: hypothetical protein VK810_01845 [Dongiaceae bacterium]|jgi:uncharacterized membrane protein YgcG|nr:hypothetical protein [Dongiaceae bacterium]